MDDNALATLIQRQLDQIIDSVNRVHHRLDAHDERHTHESEHLTTYRESVESRLTRLETATKTKWSLVISAATLLAMIAHSIFGLRLGAIP